MLDSFAALEGERIGAVAKQVPCSAGARAARRDEGAARAGVAGSCDTWPYPRSSLAERHCCIDGSVQPGERVRVNRHSRAESVSFAGYRFPSEVILLAVRWYLRYGLSYRDVEELLAERGIDVDHVTIYRWVQRFTPLLIDAARPCRHSVGDRWFVDETYVKVAGVWRDVYRAVDQHGQVIDVYVSKRRNIAAATAFFERVSVAHGRPAEVTTDSGFECVVDLISRLRHCLDQFVVVVAVDRLVHPLAGLAEHRLETVEVDVVDDGDDR